MTGGTISRSRRVTTCGYSLVDVPATICVFAVEAGRLHVLGASVHRGPLWCDPYLHRGGSYLNGFTITRCYRVKGCNAADLEIWEFIARVEPCVPNLPLLAGPCLFHPHHHVRLIAVGVCCYLYIPNRAEGSCLRPWHRPVRVSSLVFDGRDAISRSRLKSLDYCDAVTHKLMARAWLITGTQGMGT